jgi:hypothetical protein
MVSGLIAVVPSVLPWVNLPVIFIPRFPSSADTGQVQRSIRRESLPPAKPNRAENVQCCLSDPGAIIGENRRATIPHIRLLCEARVDHSASLIRSFHY